MSQLETPSNVVAKKDVVAQLLRVGLPVQTIAEAIGVSEQYVRVVSKSNRMVTVQLNSQDKALADAMRELLWKGIKEAHIIMQFGTPSERSAMVRTLVGRGMGLLGVEQTSRIEQMREQMELLVGGIRGDVPMDEVQDVIDAELAADSASTDAYNPD